MGYFTQPERGNRFHMTRDEMLEEHSRRVFQDLKDPYTARDEMIKEINTNLLKR